MKKGVQVALTDTPPAAETPSTPRSQPASASAPRGARPPSQHPTRRTRISAAWVALIVATVVLILLLVFILQNTRSVKVSYLGAHGTMPLGVALLLAAIGGVLLAGLIASLRIWQIRHRVSRAGK